MTTFRIQFRRCVCITGWLTDVAPHVICPRCIGSGAVLDLPDDMADIAAYVAWRNIMEVK